MSNTIVSPSRSAAIGPPAAASGATCPAIRPRVAPENRPSVSSATDSPSPCADDAPPSPPASRACRARPWALVADDHHVARLDSVAEHGVERRPARCRTRAPGRGACCRFVPGDLHHGALGREVAAAGWPGRPLASSARSSGRTTSCPAVLRGRRPPLRQSSCRSPSSGRACSSPASSSRCATSRMPPARCRSVATNRPLGLRSASSGTLRLMRSKSSMVSATPASRAIASRCSTAFVEPPVAATDGDGVLDRRRA